MTLASPSSSSDKNKPRGKLSKQSKLTTPELLGLGSELAKAASKIIEKVVMEISRNTEINHRILVLKGKAAAMAMSVAGSGRSIA